jgi:hypothetical protein
MFPGMLFPHQWISDLPFIVRSPILLFCATETLWIIYYLRSKQRLSRHHESPPPFSTLCKSGIAHMSSCRAFINRCQRDISHPRKYLQNWFLGTSIKDIGVHDFRLWVCWALFTKTYEQILEHEMQELEDIVQDFVDMVHDDTSSDEQLDPGYTQARCIKLNFDDLESELRPFWYYMVGFGIEELRPSGRHRHDANNDSFFLFLSFFFFFFSYKGHHDHRSYSF